MTTQRGLKRTEKSTYDPKQHKTRKIRRKGAKVGTQKEILPTHSYTNYLTKSPPQWNHIEQIDLKSTNLSNQNYTRNRTEYAITIGLVT